MGLPEDQRVLFILMPGKSFLIKKLLNPFILIRMVIIKKKKKVFARMQKLDPLRVACVAAAVENSIAVPSIVK